MLEALEELNVLWGELEDFWWCPSCGPTDCTYEGKCDTCGLPIEDNQPDMTLINKARAAIAKAKGAQD